MPGRADFLLFPSLISFDQKCCLDWGNFSHGVPTKSFSFNEQAFIRRGEKGLLLKDSWPIPIVSAATGTWLQNTISKKIRHMPLPNFFLFNSQLYPLRGTSAAQNKRQQYGYLVPSSYWHPVPTQKWRLSVFVPQFSSQWKCLPVSQGSLIQTRLISHFYLACLYTALAEKRSLELVILSQHVHQLKGAFTLHKGALMWTGSRSALGEQVPHSSTELTKAVGRKRSLIPQRKFGTGYISSPNLHTFHLGGEREFEKPWICTCTRADRTSKAMWWIGTSCLSPEQGCGWKERNNSFCVD